MAARKKPAKTVPVSEKYEIVDLEPGRYGVGSRTIDTASLDEETCQYLLRIRWPHIRLIEK